MASAKSDVEKQKASFINLRDSLQGLNADEALNKLSSLKLNPQLSAELLQAASNSDLLTSSAQETANAIKKLSSGGGELGGLGATLKGIGTSLLANPLPLLGVIGAIGAFAIMNADTFSSLSADAQQSQAAYAGTQSELNSLNAELSTTSSRINELKSKGSLSFAEQSELSNLQSQNRELESSINLKEQLSEKQSSKAAKDAEKVLTKKGYADLTDDTDINSSPKELGSAYKDSDIISASKNELAQLQDYYRQKETLEKEYNKKGTKKGRKDEIKSELDTLDSQITQYKDTLSNNLSQIEPLYQNLIDPKTGKAKSNYKTLVNDIDKIRSGYTDLDLAPEQRSQNQLDDFFNKDSNSAIRDMLIDAAASGQDLESVLSSLGLSLSSLGADVDKESLTSYFKGLSDSAAKASETIDGSMDGIQKAFSSENEGDDYVAFKGYLDKAKKLKEQGLTGTDDFKSVSEFMSYGSDSSTANFDNNIGRFERYFNTDSNQGVMNFFTDLQAKSQELGTSWAKLNDNGGWIFDIENSAEAAKAMNISAEAFDAIMGRAQDYDINIDGFHSSIEDLETAQSSLEGMKELYSTMDEGAGKDALGEQISDWEAQVGLWENDLATLDQNAVIHLKLDYDLAVLQEQIDLLSLEQKAQGGRDTETNAALLTKQMQYISESENAFGFGTDGFVVPVQYQANQETIDALYEQLSEAASEEDRAKIQLEIGNLQELQQEVLNAFSEQYSDITSESAPEDISAAWSSFFSDEKNEGLTERMGEMDTDALQNVADILGILPEDIYIPITAEDNASPVIDMVTKMEVGTKIAALIGQDDATPYIYLWQQLSADPKFSSLSASDQASYVVSVWNGLTPEQKTAILETTDNGAASTANSVASAVSSIPQNTSTSISARDSASAVVRSALATLYGANGKSAHTYIYSHNIAIPGHVNGTAHAGGTARLNGTAHLAGHAFSSGDWSVPRNERALVGELGMETVVRGGRFFTVGNHGAEFADIRRGDIIFNHRQTEELFRHGYVTSGGGRARVIGSSYARGSAYAESDGLKELKDYFDWISINLKRLKEDTKKTMDAIDTAVGLSAQQAQTSLALTKTQNEMNTARQAYDRYMSHANWFASQSGLSSDLQASVQNGTIDISKYDDDTRSKIKEYQDWYDKAKDCLDTIDDLKKQEQKLARRRLENIEDYYDAVIKVNKAMTDTNKAKLKLNEALGDSSISQDVKNTISQSLKSQDDSYKKALKQLADYQTEFNALVSGGYIAKDSDAWYDGQKQLQDFSKKVAESAAALIEFQDQLRELQYTELEQAIDRISRGIDRLKDGISLKDKRDEPVSEEDYLKQLENLNELIKSNYALRSEKVSEQNLYHVNSEKYQDLAKDISKLDKEIYDSLEDIEKLKDSIVEARLFDFTENVEEMEALMDETDAFRKLLNNDAFFDKEGMLTGSGLADIALIAQGMGLAKQQIAEYTTGLSKLSELLNNGMLSTEEYEKKQKEYNKAIRDSVFQVEDYKEELLDLYKEQMKQENETLKDNIDLREKAQKGMEKYYDYANKVKSETKDVNALKAQIAALDGVNNASARAEQKRLKAELAEAEDSLAETKRDHENDMIREGYDTLTDNLDKAYDDMNYNLIHNLEFQHEKVAEVLGKVVGSYADAYGTISSIIANTGITGTAGFNQNQADLGTASGSAGQNASASQSQGNVHSSSTAGSITTGGISADHSAIEQELSKEPDITNRKCAELTISKENVTLEEGKTTSVAVSIRPTDAANKTIAWSSSNPAIASVSGGSIKAVKPGSTVISAASTDGSGLFVSCNVTVTKKPDPPKPAPPVVPHSPQGNGVPDVGDRVTFVNGRYYEDSYGQGRRGSWYLGQQVYITSINTRGSHPYHISTGTRLGDGDLGWLKLNQIRGYAAGISHAPAGLGFFDDTSDRKLDLGSEVLITDRGVLKQMDGDTIFSKSQTERLYQLSKGSLPGSLIPQDASLLKIDRQVNQNVNVHIGSLIGSVECVTKETLPKLNEILKMAREDTTSYIVQEIKKL